MWLWNCSYSAEKNFWEKKNLQATRQLLITYSILEKINKQADDLLEEMQYMNSILKLLQSE